MSKEEEAGVDDDDVVHLRSPGLAILHASDGAPYGAKLRKLLPREARPYAADMARFYAFLSERQEIWRRRVSGQPAPWTLDAQLASLSFCNAYRELDRGTAFFRRRLTELLDSFGDDDDDGPSTAAELLQVVLFASVAYRLVNKIESVAATKTLPTPRTWPLWRDHLESLRAEGRAVFSAAHQTMGLDRYVATMTALERRLPSLARELDGAEPKVAYALLKKNIPNVGTFFAWQILCDLFEANCLDPAGEDSWVALGPGATAGVRRIFPVLPTTTTTLAEDPTTLAEEAPAATAATSSSKRKREATERADRADRAAERRRQRLEAAAPQPPLPKKPKATKKKKATRKDVDLARCRLLADVAPSAFERLGLPFHVVNERRLTLKNIEHALCEFEKYERHQRAGRRFNSRARTLDGDLVCSKCHENDPDKDHALLLCDLCNTPIHASCVSPPVDVVPEAEWFCPACAVHWQTINEALDDDDDDEDSLTD